MNGSTLSNIQQRHWNSIQTHRLNSTSIPSMLCAYLLLFGVEGGLYREITCIKLVIQMFIFYVSKRRTIKGASQWSDHF